MLCLSVCLSGAGCWQCGAPVRGGLLLAPGDTLKFDILDDDKEPVDLLIASDGSMQALSRLRLCRRAHRRRRPGPSQCALYRAQDRHAEDPDCRSPLSSSFVIGDVRQPDVSLQVQI